MRGAGVLILCALAIGAMLGLAITLDAGPRPRVSSKAAIEAPLPLIEAPPAAIRSRVRIQHHDGLRDRSSPDAR